MLSVRVLLKFARCQSGATALEYGLIIGLISLFTVNFAQSVGIYLGTTFTSLKNNLS